MNALEELKIKLVLDRTPLDFAVLVCDEMGGEATAMDAAKELLDMRSCIASLEAANARTSAWLVYRSNSIGGIFPLRVVWEEKFAKGAIAVLKHQYPENAYGYTSIAVDHLGGNK